MSGSALAWKTADLMAKLKAREPRVHCVTNAVAQNYTANALLAVGAVPSMTIAPDEIAAFVGGADALLVNLGTLDADRRTAIGLALDALGAKPWVLDPVFVDRSPERAAYARALAARHPAVIRGNEAEIAALSVGEGLDHYARRHGVVMVASGVVDHVIAGERQFGTPNGHQLMASVTAMGCAGSAVLAAFLTVAADPFEAACAAAMALGVAGEVAAESAYGPGTFASAYLDALHVMDAGVLATRARTEA